MSLKKKIVGAVVLGGLALLGINLDPVVTQTIIEAVTQIIS